jgi:large subunit ribosomal protein L10
MALTRAQKTDKVGKLAGELAGSTSAIIGTFKALTASKDFDLRKTVRAAGGSYHVVKNKLAARAGEGTKIEAALKGLKGVSSVAYTSGDPVALAKALSEWVKENSEFTFKLGIVDGKVITVQEVKELANMPGKEELFSKLLFLINSPAQRLATVLNATGRDLAVVLGQGVEKEKFAAAPAPAAKAAPATVAETAPAPAAEAAPAPVAEAPAPEPAAEAVTETAAEAAPAEGALIAEAHAIEAPAPAEAPTPTEQIAANPASEASPVAEPEPAQPENATASQAGEAATSEPAEG